MDPKDLDELEALLKFIKQQAPPPKLNFYL